MSPTNDSPPGGPSDAPQALLWSYELSRENKTLIEHVEAMEKQFLTMEEYSRNLEQYLNSFASLVTAYDDINGSDSINADEHLRRLHQQLKNNVLPLYGSAQTLMDKNKGLIKCIAELESICDMIVGPPSEESIPQPASVAPDSEDAPHAQPSAGHSGSLPIIIVDEAPSSGRRPPWVPMETTMTLETMEQNGRSLELYYDEANFLRRQTSPSISQDEAIIKRFIEGCDDRLYRRRLTHALRNGNMTWTRLGHEVQHLLNEEEYMQNQKYALAHQNEDGSVLWPDGSVKHRFIAFMPFTDSDLTTSEEEDSSEGEWSRTRSI